MCSLLPQYGPGSEGDTPDALDCIETVFRQASMTALILSNRARPATIAGPHAASRTR
jgi:hypothetical protein